LGHTVPCAVRTVLPSLIIPFVVVPSIREAGQGPAVGVERPTDERPRPQAPGLLDFPAAAGATVARKRAIFYNVLQYAVELEEFDYNPIDRINWKPVEIAETIDPRVVINPVQARELLAALTYIGTNGRGRRLMAF
jgi:hypothetical protein